MKTPVLFFVLGAVCSGQAMVEHAAAAAVGTAGSVGGKKISDGLDKIFKKTGSVLEGAAAEGKPEAPVTQKSVGSQAGAGSGSASPAVKRTAGGSRKVSVPGPGVMVGPELPPAPVPEAAPVAAEPVLVATREAFAQVTAGVSKEQMLASLGKPTSKISIPEEGRLVEIYGYRDLGSIRVVNGAVSEVRVK